MIASLRSVPPRTRSSLRRTRSAGRDSSLRPASRRPRRNSNSVFRACARRSCASTMRSDAKPRLRAGSRCRTRKGRSNLARANPCQSRSGRMFASHLRRTRQGRSPRMPRARRLRQLSGPHSNAATRPHSKPSRAKSRRIVKRSSAETLSAVLRARWPRLCQPRGHQPPLRHCPLHPHLRRGSRHRTKGRRSKEGRPLGLRKPRGSRS